MFLRWEWTAVVDSPMNGDRGPLTLDQIEANVLQAYRGLPDGMRPSRISVRRDGVSGALAERLHSHGLPVVSNFAASSTSSV